MYLQIKLNCIIIIISILYFLVPLQFIVTCFILNAMPCPEPSYVVRLHTISSNLTGTFMLLLDTCYQTVE